eukprot:7205830-Ditylum_brightwellii.AAC.1
MSTEIMDRTGAPAFVWFFYMLYADMLLNFTALESLDEWLGHCLEAAVNKGDMLTYWVLTENKQ